jgi:hypothetical protein
LPCTLCPHSCQSTIYELPAHCVFSHHHPLPPSASHTTYKPPSIPLHTSVPVQPSSLFTTTNTSAPLSAMSAPISPQDQFASQYDNEDPSSNMSEYARYVSPCDSNPVPLLTSIQHHARTHKSATEHRNKLCPSQVRGLSNHIKLNQLRRRDTYISAPSQPFF